MPKNCGSSPQWRRETQNANGKTLPFVRKVWEDSRRMNPLSDILGLSPVIFPFSFAQFHGSHAGKFCGCDSKWIEQLYFLRFVVLLRKDWSTKFLGQEGYFSAVAPREILRQAEERVEEENGTPLFSALVEDLSREQGQFGDRPGCRFLREKMESFPSFKNPFSWNKTRSISYAWKIPLRFLRYLMSEYIAEKKRFGVMSRVLVPAGIRSEKYRQLDEEGNRTTRFVPEKYCFWNRDYSFRFACGAYRFSCAYWSAHRKPFHCGDASFGVWFALEFRKIMTSSGLYCSKPIGISSFRALGKHEKHWEYKKAGHAGTLDSFAEGLLCRRSWWRNKSPVAFAPFGKNI